MLTTLFPKNPWWTGVALNPGAKNPRRTRAGSTDRVTTSALRNARRTHRTAQGNGERRGRRVAYWRGAPPPGRTVFDDGEVVCSDATSLLDSLNQGIADIVFLDPPFNLGKKYGSKSHLSDLRSDDEYLSWMKTILDSSARVLKPGGALYLYHLPRWGAPLAAHLQETLHFRDWIAISMTNGMPPPNRLYPSHYALLYFTKGDAATFHKIKIPGATCPHCGKFLKNWGGRKRFLKHGVNLSDVWTDISPIRHRKFKNRLANELPSTIPSRAISISGVKGGLLIDPFAGSGNALLAARSHRMRFLGGDLQRAYFNVLCRRLRPKTESEGG